MKTLRGAPSSSSSGADGGVIIEHRIEIPEIDIENPPPHQPPQTDHHHHSPPPSLVSHQPPPLQPHSSPRRRHHPLLFHDTNPTTLPPAFANHPTTHRVVDFRVRGFFRYPRLNCSLHAFPLLLLLGFFLLWWFSSPVKLVIKDGRIMQPSSTTKTFSYNATDIDDISQGRMAILAVATSPNSKMQFIMSMNDKANDSTSPVSSTY